MAVQEQETRLILRQNNDEQLSFTIYQPNSVPPLLIQDLTGCTVQFWRKSTRFVPDSTGTMYAGVIATDPTTGIVHVNVPAQDNTLPSVDWWRLDVLLGTQRRTANYGPLSVVAV